MLGTGNHRLPAGSRIVRTGVSALLALCCLLSLAAGTTRALCLDLGGACSPSAALPAGPCHEQEAEADAHPRCGSCLDVLIPEDALACCGRTDRDLRAPAETQAPTGANDPRAAVKVAVAAAAAAPLDRAPQDPLLRTAVLRI